MNRATKQTVLAFEETVTEIPWSVGCSPVNRKEMPHPIPYQGSKRNLARLIISYMPAKLDTLIEPFAGSAAVTLAAAKAGIARRFHISDINSPLMTLWETIVECPGAIAQEYRHLWEAQSGREREFYDCVRDQFNKHHKPSDLLYLLARCVKASVRYNTNGDFNQSPDNRRKGARPDIMEGHIFGASRLLVGKTSVDCRDYRDAVLRAAPDDVVYMDPPYQGVSGNRDARYMQGLSRMEFIETLRCLNARRISYILSYDGRTGTKSFGTEMPADLNLTRYEVNTGRSSQATLLGRDYITIEALYLSPALVERTERHI